MIYAIILVISAPPTAYEITDLTVIDGDTFVGDIRLPWGVAIHSKIRSVGYDAWESSKRRRSVKVTDEEVVLGKKATVMVIALVSKHSLYIEYVGLNRDRYGRILGRLWYKKDGKLYKLSDWMEANGLVRTAKPNIYMDDCDDEADDREDPVEPSCNLH